MNYYNEIKNILIDNAIGRKVREYKSNQKDLESYYNVGKLLVEAQGGEERAKYGNGLIKEYSKRLTSELGKGYSVRSLTDMRTFYSFCQKRQSLIAEFKFRNISWTCITKLLKLDDINAIFYYVKCIGEMNLTTRELDSKLKLKEYERLDSKIKEKLMKQEEVSVKDKIPDPIVLEGLEYKEKLTEKIVQKWIDENPASFCEALGEGILMLRASTKSK